MLSTTAEWAALIGWIGLSLVVLRAQALEGAHVCSETQTYNVTKRIKYRAPMSVRSYVWCFNVPPRCSRYTTELRDLTKLQTEERTMEVSVCCPGFIMRADSCHAKCPSGRTGQHCDERCPKDTWGPSCSMNCTSCPENSFCSPFTGRCECKDGWQGERCEISMRLTSTESMASSTAQTTKSTTQITTVTPLLPSVETTFTPKTTANILTSTINTKNSTQASFEKQTTVKSLMTTSTENIDTKITNFQEDTNNTLEKPLAPVTTNTEYNIKTVATTNTIIVPEYTIESKVTIDNVTISSKNFEITTIINSITNVKTDTKLGKSVEVIEPKEIWIKPTKGDSFLFHTNRKHSSSDNDKIKNNNAPFTVTPKTIVVSIIPTLAGQTTLFKKLTILPSNPTQPKIYSTTTKMHPTPTYNNNTNSSFGVLHTTLPPETKLNSLTEASKGGQTLADTFNPLLLRNFSYFLTSTTNKPNTTLQYSILSDNRTNNTNVSISFSNAKQTPTSLPPIIKLLTPTKAPLFNAKPTVVYKKSTFIVKIYSPLISTRRYLLTTSPPLKSTKPIEKSKHMTDLKQHSLTTEISRVKNIKTEEPTNIDDNEMEMQKDEPKLTSTNKANIEEDEVFDILTEPEHITAVGNGGNDRNTDLVSVLTIVGGVVFVLITVAVVIVMSERCRRSRYEEVAKYDRTQMTDSPPYVRSIFHTPLPDPPTTEKSHYQPISTLDRNLKQFMRPVAVPSITPVMMENFRGILECHYDHLPSRSSRISSSFSYRSNTISLNQKPSRAPSIQLSEHLCCDSPVSIKKIIPTEIAEDDIMKHEIDDTIASSEPLYAEISCWRTASQQAIDIVNLNGEAVTEL